jgi:hypothetical protein
VTSRPLSALAAFAAAAAVLPLASAQADQVVVTDARTGDTTWKVPAGVTSVALHAVGQRGGGGASSGGGGGRAGSADGTLAVTPGTTLTLRVATGGGTGGGFVIFGGAGGGLSGVLSGGVFQLIAAGGGGGGAGFNAGAGGDAGAAGNNASGNGGTGGGAGTSLAGGAAGTNAGTGTAATAGTTGAGGNGGTGAVATNGGGGGGAGRFGGGGGGASASPVVGAGGGGGGFSYVGGVTGGVTAVTDDPLPSVRIVYTDTTAPAPVLDTPVATNPTTFSGTGGTDTGDDDHVTLDFHAGSDATGPVATTLDAAVDGTTGAYSVAAPALADGTWTVVGHQGDAGGNSSDTLSWTFTVDHTAPAVSLGAFEATSRTARPSFSGTTSGAATRVTMMVTPHDAGGILTFAATLAGDGSFTATPPRDLADGPYSVAALASDAAGNTAMSTPVGFAVDTAPPLEPVTNTVTTTVTTQAPAPATTIPTTTTTTPRPVATPKLKVSLTTRPGRARHRATITVKVTASVAKASNVNVCLSGPPVGKRAKCWSLPSLAAGRSKTYTFTAAHAGTVRATAAAPGALSANPLTKAVKLR